MADDTAGKGKHLGGKIKEKAGEALGDRELRRKGRAQQIEGEAEQDQSRAEREREEAVERKRMAREAQE